MNGSFREAKMSRNKKFQDRKHNRESSKRQDDDAFEDSLLSGETYIDLFVCPEVAEYKKDPVYDLH